MVNISYLKELELNKENHKLRYVRETLSDSERDHIYGMSEDD